MRVCTYVAILAICDGMHWKTAMTLYGSAKIYDIHNRGVLFLSQIATILIPQNLYSYVVYGVTESVYDYGINTLDRNFAHNFPYNYILFHLTQ